MAPKGGIRKRLGLDDNAPSSSSGAGTPAPSPGEPRPNPSESRSVRRRMEPQSTSSASVDQELPLLMSLRRDWGLGKVSAKQVQDYAYGAQRQGAVGLTQVSASGSSGKHPQNIQRALVNIFGAPAGAPEFTWCQVPTKRGMVVQPFMLPHTWFASLCSQCPDKFASSVKGVDAGCAAFWTMMAGTPFFANHTFLDRAKLDVTIPLGFYGDGGGHSQKTTRSWSSASIRSLAPGRQCQRGS